MSQEWASLSHGQKRSWEALSSPNGQSGHVHAYKRPRDEQNPLNTLLEPYITLQPSTFLGDHADGFLWQLSEPSVAEPSLGLHGGLESLYDSPTSSRQQQTNFQNCPGQGQQYLESTWNDVGSTISTNAAPSASACASSYFATDLSDSCEVSKAQDFPETWQNVAKCHSGEQLLDYPMENVTYNELSLTNISTTWLPQSFADTQQLFHSETGNERSEDAYGSIDLRMLGIDCKPPDESLYKTENPQPSPYEPTASGQDFVIGHIPWEQLCRSQEYGQIVETEDSQNGTYEPLFHI